MTRHRNPVPCLCPDSERTVCECPGRSIDPDIEWLALQHGMSYAALAEMLGDADAEEVCRVCLVWLQHGETVVCGWCR